MQNWVDVQRFEKASQKPVFNKDILMIMMMTLFVNVVGGATKPWNMVASSGFRAPFSRS